MKLLFRVQLAVCVSHLVKLDYPHKWPAIVERVAMYLQSDQHDTWLGALICLYQLVKTFEWVYWLIYMYRFFVVINDILIVTYFCFRVLFAALVWLVAILQLPCALGTKRTMTVRRFTTLWGCCFLSCINAVLNCCRTILLSHCRPEFLNRNANCIRISSTWLQRVTSSWADARYP